MLKRITSMAIVIGMAVPWAFAEGDRSPHALEQRALSNIMRAEQVVAYAHKLMELKPNRSSAEIFVDLYLEAARLYGDASRLLKAIGPTYVPQDIVDQFSKAERDCLATVDEARRMLNKGEIVKTPRHDLSELLRKLKELSR